MQARLCILALELLTLTVLAPAQAPPEPIGAPKTKAKPSVAPPTPQSDTARAPWPREPDSFLGIRLGGSLDQVPECPLDRVRPGIFIKRYDLNATNAPCWADRIDLDEMSEVYLHQLGIAEVRGRIVHGKVEALEFSFRDSDAPEILRGLKEKYGPPHSITGSELTTGLGVRVMRATCTWTGLLVSIRFRDLAETINLGDVRIWTRAYEDAVATGNRKGVKAYRDKF